MFFRIFVAAGLIVVASFTLHANSTKTEAQLAFDKLGALVGDWRRQDAPNSKLGINFTLIAGGSVLVETWSSEGTPYSLTVYHLDRDDLVATHYCPQGNQPRLKMVKGQTGPAIEFEFWDATNLPDVAKSHQTALSFDFKEGGMFLHRGETYSEAGSDDASVLMLEKVR